MKKSILLLVVALVLIISLPSKSIAQDWSTVGDFVPEGAFPDKTIEFEGDLIVCGEFSLINGEDLGNIIRWDGTSWSQMGGNISGDFKCIGIANGELYVGGIIVEEGFFVQQAIYKWDGTTWVGTGDAVDVGYPSAFTEWNGQLVAAVHGSGVNNKIQLYNGGTSWTQVGSDIAQPDEFYQHVHAIATYNDSLFIAGAFDNVGAQEDAQRIAKFDGENWVSVNFPMPAPDESEISYGEVFALEIHDGKLFAGGFFDGYDSDFSVYPSLASYDGSSWTAYSIDLEYTSEILCLESDGEYLYCGGSILYENEDEIVTGVVAFDEEDVNDFIDLSFFNENEFYPRIKNLTMVAGSLFASGQFLKAGTVEEDVNGMAEFTGVVPQPTTINTIDDEMNQIIELYPNPALDFVTIAIKTEGKITILNSLGMIVYEENSIISTSIDISKWEPGVYYIELISVSSSSTKKIIKM